MDNDEVLKAAVAMREHIVSTARAIMDKVYQDYEIEIDTCRWNEPRFCPHTANKEIEVVGWTSYYFPNGGKTIRFVITFRIPERTEYILYWLSITLIHELAHCITMLRSLSKCKRDRQLEQWKQKQSQPNHSQQHSDSWGIAYAMLYRAVYKHFDTTLITD